VSFAGHSIDGMSAQSAAVAGQQGFIENAGAERVGFVGVENRRSEMDDIGHR
jgi:hypothetical protein